MTQPAEQPWTILRLITWTKEYFERQGIESPRLAAEVLLASVLAAPRVALYAQFERVPTTEQLTAYRALVKRAASREPVAYLVGRKEFYSLDFAVTPDVLIPRPETELLAERAIDFLKTRGPAATLWDACTGSGAVALAVAKNAPAVRVLATDISPKALAVAQRNIESLQLAERVTAAAADLLTLPSAAQGLAPFDAITANPPYIHEGDMATLPPEVQHEPRLALAAGADGLDCIRPILETAAGHLKPGGLLAMEIGYNQAEWVWDLANAAGVYERVELVKDAAGIERVLVAYAAG